MKKITGIYKIVNITTGDFYIGSSKDIKNRWNQHRHDLNHNKHPNQHLQNAWNKYGKDTFMFEVVEECECIKQIILEREQFHIDNMKPRYNILCIAGSRLGATQEISVEHRKKISLSLLGREKSLEHCQNISKAMKGKKRKPLSEDHKKLLSDKLKGKIFSDETLTKISTALKSKAKSEEHKQKISEAKKGSIPPNKGKPMSEEQKLKLSMARKRYLLNKSSQDKDNPL